jgi:hypothetical protein
MTSEEFLMRKLRQLSNEKYDLFAVIKERDNMIAGRDTTIANLQQELNTTRMELVNTERRVEALKQDEMDMFLASR